LKAEKYAEISCSRHHGLAQICLKMPPERNASELATRLTFMVKSRRQH
jgi:hypothetical protein